MTIELTTDGLQIWNWDPEGICLVFPSLRISSTESLLVSIVFRTSHRAPTSAQLHFSSTDWCVTVSRTVFALSFSFEALRVRATRDDKLLRVRYASGNSGAFVPTGRRNATLDSSSTGAAGGASGSSSRPRSPAGEPLLPRSAKGINGLGRSVCVYAGSTTRTMAALNRTVPDAQFPSWKRAAEEKSDLCDHARYLGEHLFFLRRRGSAH